jgi:hypothetical protein
MTRVAIEQDHTPVEVDLWGTVFEAKPLSRSLSGDWDEAMQRVWEAENDDDSVRLLGAALDIRLKPTGGGKKKPSAVLAEKWKADKLTVPQVNAFIQALNKADASPN